MESHTTGENRFVCGTRAVVRKGPGNYRTVCATCAGGGTVRYTKKEAQAIAIKNSAMGCPVGCGAR